MAKDTEVGVLDSPQGREIHFKYMDLYDHYSEIQEQVQAIIWGYADLDDEETI